ncbi:DNA-binding HTH domain-containing protein [Hoeflea phototrophica DFL-43]|uniref:DNA-binding HTH domain-containing protein n=1 Tax=Hoeflea phototrophica (strain DSM 17068 / NCIMB 14078 / DFL-43) TaxID=411684 RepID=A9D281_HOEPD|nr:LuxR family transcriptional regulator [Hoeflea phototrophica]EDQ34151.1 DNA-binding HTH domain-containing protein [Hoeflea phototrophica DFL-43]
MKFNEDLFQRLKTATTEHELAVSLQALTSEFDFRFFSIFDIPATFSDRLSKHIRLSNLPSEYIEEYDSLNLLSNSSVFAMLRQSTAPMTRFLDLAVKERPTEEQQVMRAVFEKHNMTMGVYFPVHGSNGRRAAMAFYGTRPALSFAETGVLGLCVLHAFDAYSKMTNKTGTKANGITTRELEVLHWAANGKTSTEIAAILSLSDHTVNTYMNSAMRKLDCVNRTQLVAKALRLHLIS